MCEKIDEELRFAQVRARSGEAPGPGRCWGRWNSARKLELCKMVGSQVSRRSSTECQEGRRKPACRSYFDPLGVGEFASYSFLADGRQFGRRAPPTSPNDEQH